VRAANTGISCFIDPAGEVYSAVVKDGRATFVEGSVTDRLYISRIGSFYVKYGDVFVYFCLVMMILVLSVEIWRLKGDKPKA
jgi:apolipoprotein N-acyltransferase